jgi:hypothetical protein
MPYIKQEYRDVLDPNIHDLVVKLFNDIPQDDVDGCMNYIITRLLKSYYFPFVEVKYSRANRLMGVLGCITQEIYRKWVAPYEDEKEKQNGTLGAYKLSKEKSKDYLR